MLHVLLLHLTDGGDGDNGLPKNYLRWCKNNNLNISFGARQTVLHLGASDHGLELSKPLQRSTSHRTGQGGGWAIAYVTNRPKGGDRRLNVIGSICKKF